MTKFPKIFEKTISGPNITNFSSTYLIPIIVSNINEAISTVIIHYIQFSAYLNFNKLFGTV